MVHKKNAILPMKNIFTTGGAETQKKHKGFVTLCILRASEPLWLMYFEIIVVQEPTKVDLLGAIFSKKNPPRSHKEITKFPKRYFMASPNLCVIFVYSVTPVVKCIAWPCSNRVCKIWLCQDYRCAMTMSLRHEIQSGWSLRLSTS